MKKLDGKIGVSHDDAKKMAEEGRGGGVEWDELGEFKREAVKSSPTDTTNFPVNLKKNLLKVSDMNYLDHIELSYYRKKLSVLEGEFAKGDKKDVGLIKEALSKVGEIIKKVQRDKSKERTGDSIL